jgi:hypothetical protein
MQGGRRHRCKAQLSNVHIISFIFTNFRCTSAKQGRRRLMPRVFAAGAGTVTTVETCVGAAA